jgi:transposase
MKDYTLSNKQIAELEQKHRQLKDKHQADRIKAVLALAKGWTPTQVAEILLFDERTSRLLFERYQLDGIAGLTENHHPGAASNLNDKQLRQLDRYLQDHLLSHGKAVIAYIRKQYGVTYSLSGVTELLHRLGFSYKKPTHVPGKQDLAQQKAFLARYKRIKDRKGKNDAIYFADATHPQHNSIPSCGWIKTGQDKEIKANCGRQRLNINGAINIETLESVVGFYETIDAQAASDLCAKLEAKHPLAKRIYVIVDNARYYRNRELKKILRGTKIKLIFLPPYSPNLNLIERYWKFFKKIVMNNCYYETFAEFKQACEAFFRKPSKYLSQLRTLLTENFHLRTA